ncbi:MAG: glycoside hydrolase family 9 protein [Pirellulales bacterium]
MHRPPCWTIGLVYLLSAAIPKALGQTAPAPPLANGSFEEGPQAPLGWRLTGQAAWSEVGAHRGRRFVATRSPDGARTLESDAFGLVPGSDYRLEGWIRSPRGEGRLGIDLVDADGAAAAQAVPAPSIGGSSEWRYVAVEFTAGAPRARVWFSAKGAADLDEVALASVALPYLGNRDVQADAKGRVGFWDEEKEPKIAAGQRAGRHRGDPAVVRRTLPSLMLEATGDWYAIGSVNYGVPAFTDQIRLAGWARSEGSASAAILACWTDGAQQVLRVDEGPETTGESWKHLEFVPPDPPAGAHAVRLVALVRGGRAWFDEFDLMHLRPKKPVVRVLVNQVGYELSGPKSAVVATNFFPADGATIQVQLTGQDGKTTWEKDVPCAGRIHGGKPDDWGWYFWRADFSDVHEPGTYRAVARSGDARGESFPFVVERGAVLGLTARDAVDFFFIQRCGCDVPGWHKACHLDDAVLADGTHVDVTGGWHSAGDYNKPMWQFGDSGSSYALVTAYAARPDVFGKFDRDQAELPDALDEAFWGAKFLAKMQNPADGSMRADVLQGPGRTWMSWKAPDVHTDNQVGTNDDPVIAAGTGNVPLSIAAWASLARALDARGVENDYLQRAERLWQFLTASDAAAGNPLILISALQMHRATGDDKYRKFAHASAQALLAGQKPDGSLPGDSGDHGDVTAAALALFALEFPDDPLRGRVVAAGRKWLDFCIARTDNPFGLSRQGTEQPEASFFHPSVGLGVNFWLLGRAWAALLVGRLVGDPRGLVYATDQIDWVLGKNPLDLCMFEGHGGRNPPRYHHRYNMIPGRQRGAVPGAIANGIVRDMGLADRPGFDMSLAGGRAPSFRTSEPWLVHNMFYLLATSALAESANRDRGTR